MMKDESTTRVFFAITLENHIKQQISHQLDMLKKSCHFQVRWVKDTQLHLTLRFLESITSDQLIKFYTDFDELENTPVFDLELQQIVTFPANKPRIIGLGISSSPQLSALVALLEKQLKKLGFEPENRTFMPHITLGRIAKPRRKTFEVDKIHIPSKQHVNHITLFKSQLTPSGSEYTVLKEFMLKAP